VSGQAQPTIERTSHRPRLVSVLPPLPWEGPAPGGVVALRYGRRDYAVRRLLAGADALALVVALLLAAAVPGTRVAGALPWALLGVLPWLFLFKSYGLYDRDIRRMSHTWIDDLPGLAHGVVMGSAAMWALLWITGTNTVDPSGIAIFAGALLLATVLCRAVARRLAMAVLGPERALLVGDAAGMERIARKMRDHPEYGVEPVGLVTADGEPSELPRIGSLEDLDLRAALRLHRVERVVVSHRELHGDLLLALMHDCKELSVKVSLVPNLVDAMGPSVQVDDVEGVTLLAVNPPVLSRTSRIAKRGMDVVGSAVLLVLLAPLLLAIALAVRLTSRGPALFRQTRVGQGGRPFDLLKFRTMVADAEKRRKDLLADSSDPHWLKLDHDPRITAVGRVLRRTSLDELPQLWNVLRGEMSLVGPRPLIDAEDRQVSGHARSRIDLTPGLTGLWQVLGRTRIPFDEMVRLDYLYVTNWSLWTDVRLLIRTLPAVVSRRGVN
jgi:exopolysaccharide biosynthesis polyprenyl glycosylphosphotransferase